MEHTICLPADAAGIAELQGEERPAMMIDALGANQVESDLLPGFAKLGLDPAQVAGRSILT